MNIKYFLEWNFNFVDNKQFIGIQKIFGPRDKMKDMLRICCLVSYTNRKKKQAQFMDLLDLMHIVTNSANKYPSI